MECLVRHASPKALLGAVYGAWLAQRQEDRRAGWREYSRTWRDKNPTYLAEWKQRHPGYEKTRRAKNPEATRNAARKWRAKNSSNPVIALVARQVFQRPVRPTFYQSICCVRCRGRRFYFRKDEPVCRRCFPASGFFGPLAAKANRLGDLQALKKPESALL
jgi:hypothetical protein